MREITIIVKREWLLPNKFSPKTYEKSFHILWPFWPKIQLDCMTKQNFLPMISSNIYLKHSFILIISGDPHFCPFYTVMKGTTISGYYDVFPLFFLPKRTQLVWLCSFCEILHEIWKMIPQIIVLFSNIHR